MRKHKGFALLAAVFVMLVFSVLATGFVSFLLSGSRLVVEEIRYNRAFYLAEAGKNFALKELSADDNWTSISGWPATKSFAGGHFTVSATNESRDALTLFSTGVITEEGKTYIKTFRATVSRDWPEPFKYVIFWDNTAGTPNTVLNLGAEILGMDRGIDVVWDVIAKGRVRVKSGSSVTGGVIYAHADAVSPEVIIESGAVVENTPEAITDFPAFPSMDYSFYDDLIASYEALLPTGGTLDINLTSGSSPYNLNTSPNYNNGVIQCRNFTVSDCTIYGSAVIAALNSININQGAIVSPEGGSIVFASRCQAAGSNINVGGGGVIIKAGPPQVNYGVIFFNQAGNINFSNASMKAYKILVLTKNGIAMTGAPNILDNSLLYSQAEDDQITFTEVGSFEGSIISRGRLNLTAGRITGMIFNNSNWGTLAELVFGSYVHGPMITRQFRNNQIAGGLIFGAGAAWDPIYLPEIPRGISLEGIAVTDWREVY